MVSSSTATSFSSFLLRQVWVPPLVYSTTEYCCSTFLNSAYAEKVGVELNKAMRSITEIVGGYLLPNVYCVNHRLHIVIVEPAKLVNFERSTKTKNLLSSFILHHRPKNIKLLKRFKFLKKSIVYWIQCQCVNWNNGTSSSYYCC